MNLRRAFPALVLVLCALAAAARARTWTTITGEHFEAEFMRVEGPNGIFNVKEKDYPYPLNRLSAADRLLIGRSLNHPAQSAPSPGGDLAPTPSDAVAGTQTKPAPEEKSTGSIQFAGQPLQPGRGAEVEIPILDPGQLRVVQRAYGKPSTKARMLLAVPDGFEPKSRSYPLLIVSATTDGAASSIATSGRYLSEALAQGFVVMAVDGEFGKPTKDDATSYRWALVAAGRDALEKEWPGAKRWPVATGGTSGGGGYASYNALKLVQERADFIGLFLAVSGWNPAKFVKDVSGLPISVAHQIPIFLSAGDKDETATRKITDQAHHEMEHDGFRNLRYEHFDGGHQLYQPHLQAALSWFLEQKGKSTASPSPSPGHR